MADERAQLPNQDERGDRIRDLNARVGECIRFLRSDLYRLRRGLNDADAIGGKYDCAVKWVYTNPPGTLFVVLEILHERSVTGAILNSAGEALSITTGADPQWLDEVLP